MYCGSCIISTTRLHISLLGENELLQTEIRRLELAIQSTENPLHIARDCLSNRQRRVDTDLVQDDAENNLLKVIWKGRKTMWKWGKCSSYRLPTGNGNHFPGARDPDQVPGKRQGATQSESGGEAPGTRSIRKNCICIFILRSCHNIWAKGCFNSPSASKCGIVPNRNAKFCNVTDPLSATKS